MPRGKKTSSGGSGSSGGTTQQCVQEGTLIVIAHLVADTTKPFDKGLDISVSPSGQSGKTDGSGMKEFKNLKTKVYKATASLSGGNASKFELIGKTSYQTPVPAGGSSIVNFDVTPLYDLKVKVKVQGSSPAVYLKPEKISLREAQGKFETKPGGDGTWEFKKLHPGRVKIDVKLKAEDAEKYQLAQKTVEHQLTETPQPNVLEVEVQRMPLLVPLHFVFKFLDPEAKPRILPGTIPVKVKLSELAPAKPGDAPPGPDSYDAEINGNGVLVVPGSTEKLRVPRSYKKLTLDFTQADARFVICEAADAPAQAASTQAYEDTDDFRTKLRAGRSFMLPWKKTWTLDTSDWDIKDGSADAKARLGQLSVETTLFGTLAQAIIFTLKPRWQFARFTFFDRYFGFTNHSKLPVAIPPVILRGYRVIPAKTQTTEAEAAAADAATKAGDLATKRDALHLAQDELDEIDNDISFKRYLKNWNEANRPVGHADRVNAVNAFNTASAPRAAAATKVTTAQGQFDTAQTASNTAANTAKTKLTTARDEWKKVMADTCSSWVHLPDKDIAKAIQCLPWILNKKPDNTADTALDAEVVLEFKTPKNSFIESTSATEREMVQIPDGDKRLAPSVGRLKVYDLPLIWRSRRYFSKLGTKVNRFEQLADKATSLTEPITFCLDDIVLCQREHGIGEIKFRVLTDKEWAPDKRCTLFHHRFRATANDGSALTDVSKQGVYKPDTAGNKSYFSLAPTGTAAGTAGDTTVEKDRNYIADYPNWTRLILALGNAYDVFDRRTPESPIGVTGARAAVCWRDVTSEMTGIDMEQERLIETSPGVGDWGKEAALNNRPSPTKYFKSRPSAWGGGQYFHLQPYVEAEYHSFRNDRFDTSRSFGIGRVDYVLLRCCGRIGDGDTAKEHAVNMHFTRNFFKFTPNPGTALASTGLAEEAWKDAWIKNCINRWNGDDPTKNETRARLLPADLPDGTKASLAMECDVMWFMHVTDRLRAQFLVNVEDRGANARDNRGGTTGTGESSPAGYQDGATTGEDFTGASTNTGWYPSAHESGHADALPDEYNERWDGASHGQMSYKSNLPGDPFEPDGRMVSWATNGSPMMNGNQLLRNRYFWVSAEWVRARLQPPGKKLPFKVSYKSPGGTGTAYDNFQLPSHPSEKRTYLYWPMRAAIDNAQAGVRGQRNFYLYPLGQEQWTIRDIYARQTPTAAPDPAKPYDGICMVTLNLETLLPSWPIGGAANTVTTETKRQEILRAVTGQILSSFNFKWYLTGKVVEGDAEWTFKRCLIFFSLRYLDGHDSGAARLRTKFGTQFLLNTTNGVSNAASWHAAVGAADSQQYDLTVNFGGALYAATIARKVRDIFPTMLGISSPWNSITTADLQPVFAPLNVQALLIHAI